MRYQGKLLCDAQVSLTSGPCLRPATYVVTLPQAGMKIDLHYCDVHTRQVGNWLCGYPLRRIPRDQRGWVWE